MKRSTASGRDGARPGRRRERRPSLPDGRPRPEAERPGGPPEPSFRFDPYWDEVFCSYYDPTLRTCCQM